MIVKKLLIEDNEDKETQIVNKIDKVDDTVTKDSAKKSAQVANKVADELDIHSDNVLANIDPSKISADEYQKFSDDEGDVEKALSRSYAKAKWALTLNKLNIGKTNRSADVAPNILLIGGTGTAKTGRVESWCAKHGVACLEVYASSMERSDVGGVVVPVPYAGVVARLRNGEFDLFNDTPGILFLDELNRAPADVTGSLLQLIANHKMPSGNKIDKNGAVEKSQSMLLPNLLFVVAAINPSTESYTGTFKLDKATARRFFGSMQYVKSNKKEALGYLTRFYTYRIKAAYGAIKIIKQHKQLSSEDSELIKEAMVEVHENYGRLNLAKKLLTSKEFEFDSTEDEDELERSASAGVVVASMNSASLAEALNACDGTKDSFLNVISTWNNPKQEKIISNILANYVPANDTAIAALDFAFNLDSKKINNEYKIKSKQKLNNQQNVWDMIIDNINNIPTKQ